ncbi:hypothetical protein ATI61_106314 [Archangium gephyra]|uniref:Uncharacterized protein n=1 Tax=Archangium gephyra TaxID=48 RepID=A0AAC8Q0V6_9BACT|nr:hypothetical protein [Archangium gephyra]AKI98933.1 Hypothetical protein AA314_00560 [Archangium gephyra]REG30844.1 hypothetical protein ATI61_106314 [Archangium gephyra]
MRLRVLRTRERVYDGAVSDSTPSVTPSRSLFIGAIGVLALSVPFFIFGLSFLNTKARIELQCQRGGACALIRSGWLTKEPPIIFSPKELQSARIERGRSPRGEQQNIYRPVLVTTRGEFPLSHQWMEEEREANRTVVSVNRFLKNPESPGFTLWHDNRPRASRMGAMFTVAAVLVLLFGLWLTWRAMRRRREERAQGTAPGV